MDNTEQKVSNAVDTMMRYDTLSRFIFKTILFWIIFSTIEFFIRGGIDKCFIINLYRQSRLFQTFVLALMSFSAGMGVSFKISLETMTALTNAIKEVITSHGGINNDR